MILVDTSIWIDHFRSSNRSLVTLMDTVQATVHPWVTGELACRNLPNRSSTLYLLKSLPQAAIATEDEVLFLIDKHRISGKGVGYLDMHLLAAAALGNLKIWTRDKRLGEIAALLGLNASINP